MLCKGTKRNGSKCNNRITCGNYCWIHANQGKKSRLVSFFKTYKKLGSFILVLSIIGSIIGGADVIGKYLPTKRPLNIGFVAYDFKPMDSEYSKVILTKFGKTEVEYRLRNGISYNNKFIQSIHIGISKNTYAQEKCYEFSFDLYNFSERKTEDINIVFDVRHNDKKIIDRKLICDDVKFLWEDYRGETSLKRKILNTSHFSKVFYKISELPPNTYSLYMFPINISELNVAKPMELIITGELLTKHYGVKKNELKLYFHLVEDVNEFKEKIADINADIINEMIMKRPWYYNITSHLYYDFLPDWLYDNRFETLIIYNNEVVYKNLVGMKLRFNPAVESCDFAFYPKKK